MKNVKLNKKCITAIIMAGSMLVLSGCGKGDSKNENKSKIIKSYNLSDVFVVTRSDGTTDIANKRSIFTLGFEHQNHDHYQSLLTGEFYSVNSCEMDEVRWVLPSITVNVNHYSSLTSSCISSYLTTDEILKIKNGGFTCEDEELVIKRIIDGGNEFSTDLEEEATEVVSEAVDIDVVDSSQNNTSEVLDFEGIVDVIDEDIKYYDLSKLFVSETVKPNDFTKDFYIFEHKELYTFEQTDYISEPIVFSDYYEEYHGDFCTVGSDCYYLVDVSLEDLNPLFVTSDLVDKLTCYLNEDEILLAEKNGGKLTEVQLDSILNRIRNDYTAQMDAVEMVTENKTYVR